LIKLSYLIGAFSSVRNHNGELKVLNPTKNVQDVLQKTKLNTILEIKEDETAALRSFYRASPG
jgi:anti-sigma B factor antagonist